MKGPPADEAALLVFGSGRFGPGGRFLSAEANS